LVDQITGFQFHRGILACGCRKPGPTIAEAAHRTGQTAIWVVCAGVQDPENLGGILRNCIAFGVDTVVLASPCADPFSRRVVRVSMGAVFKLTLVVSRDLTADLPRLCRDHDFALYATVLDDQAERVEEVDRPRRLALLFGNEGHGLGERILPMCHRQVTIPMSHGTDSLNAAVASGIFLYHFAHLARCKRGRS
jgi:tRNA G18 (ribose-2'-O)-methylase SpoU